MDELEQDVDSSSALDVNKLPPVYPCVTREESTEKPDGQRKRPSETSLLPGDESESGSLEKISHKKSAIEHDESDIQVIEPTTSLAASSGYLSEESLERRSHEVVSSAASGQVGPCVRTVAETSPMPDLFGQDEDGDT